MPCPRINWDEIFAYETPKVVRVLDRRLGLLRLVLLSAIAAYVVGYVVIYNKGYLDIETPTGVVYSTFQMPLPSNTSATIPSLDYCSQYTGTAPPPCYQQPCDTWDELQVSHPFPLQPHELRLFASRSQCWVWL